ncbi:MAG: 4-diphosphocytidyl-2C-methyl-D-erythritol kinase [Synergistaceae bacterium]|jgi:4-diphosphocytidyl-2-C-methyl-D-erythritol kinase|nr:4-diphosphocytidyl-2C-methyl-D-erythritol kinase [Synergistaceae bacterium]
MFFIGTCFIKLNLTLRVTSRRKDGYHDIFSLFWRLRSPETIEADFDSGHEGLEVTGVDIQGENILTRVFRHIRGVYGEDALPPARVRLHKHIPTGSGVGAGSGNAAAFLRVFRALRGGGPIPGISSLGADVVFLASGHSLALASGIGDLLESVSGDLRLVPVIFFPGWSVGTFYAYRALDEIRASGGADALSADEARDEALSVLSLLRRGERVGMLPNDFVLCAGHDDEYTALRGAAYSAGALAWGLCGSGGAFFALFRPDDFGDCMPVMFDAIRGKDGKKKFQWLQQILVLE